MNDLRRLAEAATPGPWHAPGLGEVHAPDCRSVAECSACNDPQDDFPPEQIDANAAYIAACSPDRIWKLLDVVEAARAAMESNEGDAMAFFGKLVDLRSALQALDSGIRDMKEGERHAVPGSSE